jgi:hypothetical protein
VYLPLIFFSWKDAKDYPWLGQRDDLFRDKIPPQSKDTIWPICPPLSICDNYILVPPLRLNLSAMKRRTLEFCSCRFCRLS